MSMMNYKTINILINGVSAGILEESENGKKYRFTYNDNYTGESVSFKIPIQKKTREFDNFPEYFENLLPEGLMLDGLCKMNEIGKNDNFSQLIAAGKNLLGNIEIEIIK
jgi:serine/threonine-protein kinase HipA